MRQLPLGPLAMPPGRFGADEADRSGAVRKVLSLWCCDGSLIRPLAEADRQICRRICFGEPVHAGESWQAPSSWLCSATACEAVSSPAMERCGIADRDQRPPNPRPRDLRRHGHQIRRVVRAAAPRACAGRPRSDHFDRRTRALRRSVGGGMRLVGLSCATPPRRRTPPAGHVGRWQVPPASERAEAVVGSRHL